MEIEEILATDRKLSFERERETESARKGLQVHPSAMPIVEVHQSASRSV